MLYPLYLAVDCNKKSTTGETCHVISNMLHSVVVDRINHVSAPLAYTIQQPYSSPYEFSIKSCRYVGLSVNWVL